MQPPYETFTAADFLTDDLFVYHQLTPTAQSAHFWENWFKDHPDRQTEWQLAVDLLAAIRLGLDEYAQTYLPEDTIQQLLIRIQQTNAQLGKEKTPVRRVGWIGWVAAASVFLALGLGIWWQTTHRTSLYEQQLATLNQTFTEKVNTSQQLQTLRLPDQSVVSLAPDSRLTYGADFGQQKRIVYLSGEATFAVTSDSKRPFLVHANEVITKVVGTQFTVRAFATENRVQIRVQSGQVSVYRNGPANSLTRPKGVMLSPNQQVVFNRQTDQFDKMLVETPSLIPTLTRQKKTPAFVYNDTPIPQVLEELKAAYGIDIRYNKEVLTGCQLTSSMTNESFEQKINIICRTIGATYELIDGQVLISGGNCQHE